MKKLILPILVGGWLVAYLLGRTLALANSVPLPDAAVALVTRAFAATHARATGYEIHNWTTLANQAMALPALKQVGKALVLDLGLDGQPTYSQKESGIRSLVYSAKRELPQGGSATIRAELMSITLPGAPQQTVLAVTELATTGDPFGLLGEDTRVQNAVAAVGGQPHINVTLVGYLPRPLDTPGRAAVVRKAFAAVGATRLQATQDKYTTGVSGHAHSAAPALASGGQELNLQVGLHKDDYQRDTVVLVGNPIITIEY